MGNPGLGEFSFHEMMEKDSRRSCKRGGWTATVLLSCFECLLFLWKGIEGFECSSELQRRILSSEVNCSSGTTMLDLHQFLPESNLTKLGVSVEDVLHMVPDSVPVKRCKGGCSQIAHSCQPTQVVERHVEVMLVLARWPQGENQVVCSSFQVEDHLSCGCGCKVKPHQCSQHHYFLEGICKCLCRHTEKRASCIKSGRSWDEKTCACTCPRHTWTQCSTGYVFDSSFSCSCVLTSALASQSLLPSLVLVTLVIVLAALLLIRRAIGQRNRRMVRTPLFSKVNYEEGEKEVEKTSCSDDLLPRRARLKPRRQSY